MAEQVKVKAVWWNDPSRTREFTKVAFEMITHEQGWILADDQSNLEPQKKTTPSPVAGAAVVAAHNAEELAKARANYKEITGEDAPKEWGEPKLFIETQKAIKLKASQPQIQEVIEVETNSEPVTENVTGEKTKRKYTKKAKTEQTA